MILSVRSLFADVVGSYLSCRNEKFIMKYAGSQINYCLVTNMFPTMQYFNVLNSFLSPLSPSLPLSLSLSLSLSLLLGICTCTKKYCPLLRIFFTATYLLFERLHAASTSHIST